ncbi:MAG TPA: lysoplasmalogenase [Polyangiales bacterium]|nr:lysoplasmalogenase [Polyangiales bacterium]
MTDDFVRDPAQQLLAAVTLAAVALLLLAERRQWRTGIWIAKPLASLGFVAVAWLDRAPTSSHLVLMIGFALCALGDVLLIPTGNSKWFLLGIGSFALGHLAFAVGFFAHGIALVPSAVALAIMAGVVAATLRWLRPHLPADMRVPVRVYMLVIALMVASAIGASAASADLRLAIGAVAFAASDLSVARERFVHASFANLLWGLPLYYVAQLALAFASAS